MRKVAIVDDEAPARSLLKEYLKDFPEMVVVCEANNGVDAIRLINEFKPEIIFLDVQMPGLTGFDVLQKLIELPQVIFSTAYDQYALNAFEVNAVDYLLKPYTRERFSKAVEKLQKSATQNLDNLKMLAQNLLEENTKTKYPGKIIISKNNRLITVDVSHIIWVDADKDYSSLITSQGKLLSNYGIGQIAEKLNPEVFIRVHRSSIININHVKEIFKYPSSYDVKMSNNDIVRVSRSYLSEIRKLTF